MKTLLTIILLSLWSCMLSQPQDLLVYYGFPNSFNSSVNLWSNTNVANDMAKYDIIVFGDGLQDTSHIDYDNFKEILAKDTMSTVQVFGYVSCNQDFCDFADKVAAWKYNVGIDGIFIDEAGYDFGDSTTNGREAFNQKVEYAQCSVGLCIVNAWNSDHVLKVVNDPLYPNSTFNIDSVATSLTSTDYYLLESYLANYSAYTDTLESPTQWRTRIGRLSGTSVKIAGISLLTDVDSKDQEKFDVVYIGAIGDSLDVVGSANKGYAETEQPFQVRRTLEVDAGTSFTNDTIVTDNWLLQDVNEFLKIDFKNKRAYKIK